MKRGVKKALIIVGSIIAVFVVIGTVMFMLMGKKASEALAKQVNVDIDMNQVADGTYNGTSDGGMVKVEVAVTVKDHKISSIDLIKHQNGKGKPAEAILDVMVDKNTDNVDSVSGATLSSKTIRNAVNQALQKGLK